MDNEQTRDDLTPDEVEQAADTGATPTEEHRAGEFEELKALLDSVITKLDSLASAIGDITSVANSVNVDNGATFTDDAGEVIDEGAAVEIANTVENPRERDYTIER